MRLVEYAPAKVNLFLGVQPGIVDGRHLLTSVFSTIALFDKMTFDFEEGTSLDNNAVTLEIPEDHTTASINLPLDENIVMQAVKVFLSTFGAEAVPAKSLHIRLEKQIPTQAGLGGGSSDAAATLKALAHVAGVDSTATALFECARSIGSDVSFFLCGGCAHMDGFGDKLVEQLVLPELDLVLAKPTEGVSTREVYRAFDELAPAAAVPDSAALITALRKGADVLGLTAAMANNLEPVSIKLLSTIADIKQHFDRSPGVIHSMISGSGSTVFGICRDAEAARQFAEYMMELGYWACATTTLPAD